MIFERLGVITDEVSSQLIEALDWAVKQGLTHVELRMVDGGNVANLTDEELDHILEEVEKRGLFVSGVASPIFKCALDPARSVTSGDTFGQKEETVEEHFKKLGRIIQVAKKLKTNKIRIFSFWREKNPELYVNEIAGHLAEATKVAETEDILLLLENEGACNGGYAVEVAELVKRVNSPNLKVLWDPGNEEHAGRSAYPEGYEVVKGLIGHMHLKDAFIDNEGQPKCVPIGEGHVDYSRQFKALKDEDYKGLFTIETHYIPEGGTAMEGTHMTLEGLRKLLDS